ncbi:hypothetical protein G7046_g2956 [Stylonectria norvegica]|nr:hypothetical protein G7046_g2956 [Stylonectria norvegica]
MDSHLHPEPSGDRTLASSSSSLHAPSQSQHGRRTPSPSPSRQSFNPSPTAPPTPGAINETADGYFQPLSRPLSTQSRASLSSFRAPSRGEHPAVDQGPRTPSIRIRRASNGSLWSLGGGGSRQHTSTAAANGYFGGFDGVGAGAGAGGGRPRSISQPERAQVHDNANLARHSRRLPQIALPRLTEEGARPSLAELGIGGGSSSPLSPTLSLPASPTQGFPPEPAAHNRTRMRRARNVSRIFWPGHHKREGDQPHTPLPPDPDDEYAQELVDWLDIIDPEVQTLSTLTNVQNSLFIPDLGTWVNRRPTYVLSQNNAEQQWARGAVTEERRQEAAQLEPPGSDLLQPPPMERTSTITSRLTESHYAALPHGASLEGWSAEEKRELDDHVRHMLHSRRSRFKRRLRGFGQYVRRPLGFFVTLYATLITLFGLAWVLFLIGWIYVGEKQVYAIHVIDSVLVALFAIMGDGLAPFRAVDTYHMIFVARYSRIIENAKKGKRPRSRLQKRNIPDEVRASMEFQNADPYPLHPHHSALPPCDNLNTINENGVQDQFPDLEDGKSILSGLDYNPLTYAQQKSLAHHKKKLAKSHSFYKPRETFTHHAFPLSYLIAIVILLDCHSLLQISLGSCTWGIDYHTRPFALTTVILCVSITCNITAGLVITRGDRKTRKKDVFELMDRQELTQDAIKEIEERRKKDQEREASEHDEPRKQEDIREQEESEEEGRLRFDPGTPFKAPSF